MEKIYILYGVTGEYSDRQEWLVRAYKSHTEATAVRERCTQYAMATPDYWKYDWKVRAEYAGKNPDDPNMTFDYTGTEYGIYEVELV